MDTNCLLEESMNGLKHAFNISLDVEQYKNFGPLSNLRFIGNSIKHVVFRRLSTHFEKSNINTSEKHDYEKDYSCKTLHLKLIDDVLIRFEGNFALRFFYS